MKESDEKDKKEIYLICSICHKKKLDIKQNYPKLKKVYNENLNNNELSELIKKCNCNSNNNNYIQKSNNSEVYAHKYCILLKIIFNFEIKCENCNTIYNIKIDKKLDKNKKKILLVTFLIIYVIHLFIYLFCMFLLFINVILKENIPILYKHLSVFFGFLILILNSIFLYFSIVNNIQKYKNNIYKYTINIFDAIDELNNKNCIINKGNEFFYLIFQFYQWFYNQSMKHLINNLNKNIINNKIIYLYENSIKEYIKKNNNLDIIHINKKENEENNTLDLDLNLKQDNINNNNDITKEMILKKNIAKVNINTNILNKDSKNIQKEIDIFSNKSNNSKNELSLNKLESNNNSNNYKKSLNNNTIDDFMKLNHKEFINININPKASKNININIHFSSDKNSQIDYSSSKEITFQSNKKFNKVGKTAVIPKNLTMSNIISEANSFKRKRRQLKSFKIKENKLILKGTSLSGDIVEDEEIDFSEFEKMGSKISKLSKDKNIFYQKNELKYSNFRTKKSYKDVELNISNSDAAINHEIYNNQNIRNSVKNINKHVHFAD